MRLKSCAALLSLAVISVACGGGGGSAATGGAPIAATVNPVIAWAQPQTPVGLGGGTCFSRAVAVHADGWSVVVGSMDSDIYVDNSNNNTLPLPDGDGNYSGFVARYEADGTLGWSNSLECDSPCTAYSVAVMTDGDVVVCGYFEGTLILRQASKKVTGVTLTSSDGEDGFVARYAGGDGSLIWGVRVGGKATTQALSVAPLAEGACAVGGLFQYEAYFYSDDETGVQENPSLGTKYGIDGFVLKYDYLGALQWAVSTQGADDNNDGQGYSAVWSVATDVNGKTITAAGSFAGTLTFSSDSKGNYKFTSTTDANGIETSDVFLATFNNEDGTLNWAQVFGGADYDETYSVAVQQNDEASIRVTGTFRGDIIFNGDTTVTGSTTGQNAYLAKFNSDGSFAWANGTIGDTGDDAAGFSSAIDSEGGTVIIGWFWGALSFDGGKSTITNNDSRDIFMARYTSDGGFDWAKVQPGTDKNAALGCAILTSDDTIWVCGFYHQSLTLIGPDNGKGGTNDTTLNGTPSVMNGFLARFDDDGSL